MKSFLTLFLFLTFSISKAQQAGTIDYSFGDSGKVFNRAASDLRSLVIQNKKIIAGGYSEGDSQHIFLCRYTEDGILDSSFGNNGISVLSQESVCYALALQTTNKIIAVGYVGSFLVIIRYNENGLIDSSFGDNGMLLINPEQSSTGLSVAVNSNDNSIIVVGLTITASSGNALLVKCSANGILDASFGNNGIVETSYAGKSEIPNSVVLQNDNKVVIGGRESYYINNKTGADFLLMRYNTDGSIDKSFGKSGKVITDFKDSSYDEANSLVLQQDGKLVLGGRSVSNEEDFALARFTTTGIPDSSFGTYGKVQTSIDSFDIVLSLSIEADKKIIAVGLADYNVSQILAIARYNINGSLDSTFGENGIVKTKYGYFTQGDASVIQQDQKIVTAGIASEGGYINRYNNDANVLTINSERLVAAANNNSIILNWSTVNEFNNNYFSIERSSNGSVSFTEIGKIFSKGNSNLKQLYSFIDDSPLEGINFYRLKNVLNDGQISYSNITSLNINATQIKLSPNPVSNILNINGLSSARNYQLKIIDIKGNVLDSKQLNTISFYKCNTSSLSAGIYYIIIKSDNGELLYFKFIKK